jgi:hypothetical protein
MRPDLGQVSHASMGNGLCMFYGSTFGMVAVFCDALPPAFFVANRNDPIGELIPELVDASLFGSRCGHDRPPSPSEYRS